MSDVVKELKTTTANLDGFAGYTGATEGEEEWTGVVGLTKFKEPKWYHNGVELPPGDEYIVTRVSRWVIKWPADGGPPSRFPVPDGEKFPDLQTRNEETPREEWVTTPDGKPNGPWDREHHVHLLNKTHDEFIFVTSTIGGSMAVAELVRKVNSVRKYYGKNNICPVVTLSHTFMPTRFRDSGQQRPHFVIVRWVEYGGGEAVKVIEAPSTVKSLDQFAAGAQTFKEPSAKDEIGDEIVY